MGYSDAVLVVPCYNEAARLRPSGFRELTLRPGLALLFVDDGSTDDTGKMLQELCSEADHLRFVALPRNRGKAEAVRVGLLAALDDAAAPGFVGFLDADLATPPAEVIRLLELMGDSELDAAMGSRIRFLGSAIARSPFRHYVGRVFATLASLILRVPVYDTQCGAKVFRNTPALRAALSEPFLTRWCFDIELLGRLLVGSPAIPPVPLQRIHEMPLREWTDVRGSKLNLCDGLRVALDLFSIERDLTARRRRISRS